MKISGLKKQELVRLKNQVDTELKKLADLEENRANAKKIKKGTIGSLRSGDKIFGIRLSFGGHRLVDPEELIGEIDIISYCDVESNEISNDGDMRISISHPKEAFGIASTLDRKIYENDHCLLFIDSMKSGYDSFYTLKPETWKKDLRRSFSMVIKMLNDRHAEELMVREKKLDMFFSNTRKINQRITNQ